jgi:5'-3' exonuclease
MENTVRIIVYTIVKMVAAFCFRRKTSNISDVPNVLLRNNIHQTKRPMMNKHRVLLIDMNLLFIRCFTVVTKINEQGVEVGGYAGTITTLLSIVGKLDPDFVICVWDGKNGSAKRREKYGMYKEGRKVPNKIGDMKEQLNMSDADRKKSIRWQMTKTYTTLKFLPFMQVALNGYEADDIISYICTEQFANHEDVELIIVSNDKDFLQLVGGNVSVYRRTVNTVKGVKHGEDSIYDEDSVRKKFSGLSRGSLLSMRMFEGDSSDNIGGIKGVAEKTFVKYLGDLAEVDDLDPRDLIEFLKEKAIQFKDPEHLKEHKEDAHLLPIIKRVSEHKEADSNLDGFDVLKRNYDIMQLRKSIISLDKKFKLDEKISNYDPIFDMLHFYATLKRDGADVYISKEAHETVPQLVRRTTKFLEEKYSVKKD